MRAAERRPGGIRRLARRVIAWLLPPEDRSLLAELDELHEERSCARGRIRADLWYVRQASGFVVRLAAGRLAGGRHALLAGANVLHAMRSLRRRPGWTFGVLATLGIGVGGVAAVYAVAHWVLLRPVPGVSAGDGIAVVRLGSAEAPAHVSWNVSHADYESLREQLTAVRDLAATRPVEVHVTDANGSARRIGAEVVSANFFEVLGVRPFAGRVPDASAMETEAVVTRELAREIAGDPAAAPGRELRVNGRPVRVAGVAPAGFRGADLPGRAQLWLPLSALPVLDPSVPPDIAARSASGVWSRMYGRMADGATVEGVEAVANAVMERIRTSGRPHTFQATHYRFRADAGLGPDPSVRASVRNTLALLGAASLFLLVLAVANVANLAAMEATSRSTSNSIRFALGARMHSLCAQWLVEAVLLGMAGAAVAQGVAMLLGAVFRRMRLDAYGAPLEDLQLGGRVLLFTFAIGILASLVAGLPVALAAGRARALSLLTRTGRGASGRQRLRSAFVIVQVAISVVLIASAGLLGRTVANLRAVDLGFTVDDLLVFSIDPALAGQAGGEALELLERVERALAEQPGVAAAGFVAPAPLTGSWLTKWLHADGATSAERRIVAAQYGVTPGFLRAFGGAASPLRAGEVIVTRSLAARAFPEADPGAATGRVLHSVDDVAPPLRIAHVIGEVRLDGMPGEPPATILLPIDTTILEFGGVTGWVRTTLPVADAARTIRETVAGQTSEVPVYDLGTARAALDRLSAERVVLARIAAVLGVLGVALAAVGLYGVLGCAVTERLRELGVRAALGATHRHLLSGVALRGLRLGLLGCAIGLPSAIAASHVLRSRLFGVKALDPATHSAAVVLVLGLALLASVVPARKAMRVSPMSVIRTD